MAQNQKVGLFGFFSCALIAGAVICSGLIGVLIVKRLSAQKAGLKDYNDLIDPKLNPGGYMRPNIHEKVTGVVNDRPVNWVTNSKGFKNDKEFSLIPQKGGVRVLYIGDSFVMAYRIDHRYSSGVVIERLLRNNIPKDVYNNAEVLVAGAYDPAYALEYIKEYGKDYHPDIVVLGICLANDIAGAGFRQYDRNQNGKVNLGQEYLLQDEYDKMFGRVELPPEAYVYPPKYQVRAFGDTFMQPGFYFQPLIPQAQALFGGFEQVLKNFNDYLKGQGIIFMPVLLPLKEQVYYNLWIKQCELFGLDKQKFDLLYPNKRIAQFCRKENIPLLDLTPFFVQKAPAEKGILYIEGTDIHFNERGNELAAEVISYFLLNDIRELKYKEVAHG